MLHVYRYMQAELHETKGEWLEDELDFSLRCLEAWQFRPHLLFCFCHWQYDLSFAYIFISVMSWLSI
jgi:hypothetical protein